MRAASLHIILTYRFSICFLQFTTEFIFLVPVKIAAALERSFQSRTGTVEPDLDVVHRQAEDVCYLGIGETLNVLEDQGFSVFLRKTVNKAAYSRVHLFAHSDGLEGSHPMRGAIKSDG